MTSTIRWCRHHSSPAPLTDHCALGVDIGSMVKRGTQGAFYKLPCHDLSEPGIQKAECVKCSFFTDKEIAAKAEEDRKWLDKFNERLIKMAPLLGRLKDRKGKSGSCNCPICGETARWSCAPNGHIRMKCPTEDCVNFVE